MLTYIANHLLEAVIAIILLVAILRFIGKCIPGKDPFEYLAEALQYVLDTLTGIWKGKK